MKCKGCKFAVNFPKSSKFKDGDAFNIKSKSHTYPSWGYTYTVYCAMVGGAMSEVEECEAFEPKQKKG